MPQTYCRPHPKFIKPDMRFVVRSSRGVNTGTAEYKRGEEFPGTAVNARTLVMLYDQFRIELHPEQPFPVPEKPKPAPEASPAAAAAPPTARKAPRIDLDVLSKNELASLAKKHGVDGSGSKDQLRSRLAALVG